MYSGVHLLVKIGLLTATVLATSIGARRPVAAAPPPTPAGDSSDGGPSSLSGDNWLGNLMLAGAIAFIGTTSLLVLCAKRSEKAKEAPDNAAKVHAQIRKIKAGAPDNAAAYQHTVDHEGELRPKEWAELREEILDAIGAKKARAMRAQAELDLKRKNNLAGRWRTDCLPHGDPYSSNPWFWLDTTTFQAAATTTTAALAAAIDRFITKGFGTAGPSDELGRHSAASLKKMPLASTDISAPAYTVSAPGATGITGANVQRVLGYLCVLEARHRHDGNAAAAEKAAEKVAEAAAIYTARVLAASPALARTIISDVGDYAAVMAALAGIATEQEALERLRGIGAKHKQTVPGTGAAVTPESAAVLVTDSGGAAGKTKGTSTPAVPSPPSTSPAFAVRARHLASGASIVFYKLLLLLLAGYGNATVVPGSVKKLRRFGFKTEYKYDGDYGECHDLVRATIEVNTLAEVADLAELILKTPGVLVVRVKNRFDPSYDALPIGGYRDLQLLVVFEEAPGVWRWAELQINLAKMVAIKSRPGGGHDAFKFARSIGAYDTSTVSYKGVCDEALCDKVKAGMMLKVDLDGDVAMKSDPALLAKLCEALKSTTCRVTDLNLDGNGLGPVLGSEAIAEALKVNTSITHINLSVNDLDADTGKAIADALKANRTIQSVNLSGNMLGPEGGKAIAEALETNKTIKSIDLQWVGLDAAAQTAIKAAWGDRGINLKIRE